MQLKFLTTALCSLLILSCQTSFEEQGNILFSEHQQKVDEAIWAVIYEDHKIFNWNEQSDHFICEALPLAKNILVAGFENNAKGKQSLDGYLVAHSTTISLQNKNEKLGFYFLKTQDCEHIGAIRNLDGIVYVELDYFPEDVSRIKVETPMEPIPIAYRVNDSLSNPGLYNPSNGTYMEHLQNISNGAVDRATMHNMDDVFNELNIYGSSQTGIAVIDNGVLQDEMDFFAAGPGGYEAEGFYKWKWWNPNAHDDGIHPLPYDFLGIWYHTPGYDHGSGMTDNAYEMAPFSHRKTVRASPTYVILTISQLKSITDAVSSLADDDQIKIISMSMGGPFGFNQLSSAIRYFNNQNKLFIVAGGSSLPVLKDILGILFPARLSETISVTGVEPFNDETETMSLGLYAHGGPQNDFVLEDSESSSTATSTVAGMITAIRDINPDLDRTAFFQLMVENSQFYNLQGSKDPLFGWGKIDMYELALDVIATL